MPGEAGRGRDPAAPTGLRASLNLGIMAHVDAGKTSLTERLLQVAGVLDRVGTVDTGTTVTDTMDIERRRGITVRSAVTSFQVRDISVNLIDTPGHPDFIAEVERALAVLDGAILVVSAVEGVQPQTIVIWRALQRLQVPTLLFINKIDRSLADPGRVLTEVRSRLSPRVVSMSRITGAPEPTVRLLPWDDPSVVEVLAEVCPTTLAEWADGVAWQRDVLLARLRERVARAEITPVLAGSAITGAGVAELVEAAVDLLPHTAPHLDSEPTGVIFNVDRDDRGKRAFVRMDAGALHVRKLLSFPGRPRERITSILVSAEGGLHDCDRVIGGQIAVLRGLASARVGDTIGAYATRVVGFAPPTLEAVVEAVNSYDKGRLHGALSELAEHDPMIGLRVTPETQELTVSLFGEVQKEVIASLLDDWYGIEVRFNETIVICVERLVGRGSHLERIRVADNPYLGTVGLQIEPAPVGTGLGFELAIEKGSMPRAFFNATEEGVRTALEQGLSGWQVTDCLVTMTHAGYLARQSHSHQKFSKASSSVASDFRNLGQLVVFAALREARTVVCEPIDRVELEIPAGALDQVLGLLGKLGGRVDGSEPAGDALRIAALVRTEAVRDLAARLLDVTSGEAIILMHELDGYEPCKDAPPTRPRVGPDPGNRVEWFREMSR